MACTAEAEKCRSFSFGIGVKGNATCELSHKVIKETPDLKPIGTISDIEYDLYIKKLGCKLVVTKEHGPLNLPKPLQSPVLKDPSKSDINKSSESLPSHSSFGHSYSSSLHTSDTPFRVHSSMISIASSGDLPPSNSIHYKPQRNRYDFEKPNLNWLSNNGYEGDRPPFRPTALNHPYDDRDEDGYYTFSVRPNRPNSGNNAHWGQFGVDNGESGYGSAQKPHRPHTIPNRPDTYPDRPYRPIFVPERPTNEHFPSPPPKPEYFPERPQASFSPSQNSISYGGNFKPHRPNVIPQRPLNIPEHTSKAPVNNSNVSERPSEVPVRPSTVSEKPVYEPIDDYAYDLTPHRPSLTPERPISNLYGQSHFDYEDNMFSRPPLRPDFDTHGKPYLNDNRYNSKPYRPNTLPARPDFGIYGQPDFDLKPNRPIPVRPVFGEYGESHFDNHGYDSKPYKPNAFSTRPDSGVYGRPHLDSQYDSKPHEPLERPGFDHNLRPHRPFRPVKPEGTYGEGSRPQRPQHVPEPPLMHSYNGQRPESNFQRPPRPEYETRPQRPFHIPERPYAHRPENRPIYDRIDYDYYGESFHGMRPVRPIDMIYENSLTYGSVPLRPEALPGKPSSDPHVYGYGPRPSRPSHSDDLKPHEFATDYLMHDRPSQNVTTFSNSSNVTSSNGTSSDYPPRRIVTESVGDHGEIITSIITELKKEKEACFRRVLAGKRTVRSLVRKSVLCERVEDCQRECSDERRFVCEGFNYRLDSSGRGLGDCELLDLPLSRLDLRRDIRDDSDYDYYERDRNNNAPDCIGHRYDDNKNARPYQFDNRYNYNNPTGRTGYDDDYHFDDSHRYYNRGDYNHYHQHDEDYYKYYKEDSSEHSKLPIPAVPTPHKTYYDDYKPIYPPAPYDHKSYEPYLPHGYWKYERPLHEPNGYWNKYFRDRSKDRYYWGLNKHHVTWGNYGGSYGNFGAPDSYYGYNYDKNNKHYLDSHDRRFYYEPHQYGGPQNWGRYGGTYGSGLHSQQNSIYNYWGFNHLDEYGGLLPPHRDGVYLPPPVNNINDYENVYKDECSLRMATGFRLHKGSVKKIVSVPSVHECELLCYKEREFPCISFAFRYTIIPNARLENCYLTDREYKVLDLYNDVEPDRDFDIYSMHNKNKCERPHSQNVPISDCFWRVRSGQRLDSRVVKDSLTVKSIVECELECLRSNTFTCRTFSFRYGSPIIGGVIDNCQLTDWPFADLDPHAYLKPEHGFEVYERGSYGHGCEPYHFFIWKKPEPGLGDPIKDQKCYIGHGSPARLLPQATKKSIRVDTEAECMAECTKIRQQSLFQCLSLSYRTVAPPNSPNCDLSDIAQRDLLSNVDYIADPDSWLFALDLHNPQCVNVVSIGSAGIDSAGIQPGQQAKTGVIIPWITPAYPLDTWRIYSVNGFPCKNGNPCQENRVSGFWYCELEGREEHSWDYCCRPDHQCGYSEGFPYQWCYVGPVRTQWRKCSDHYYPYGHNEHDKFDNRHPIAPYLPDTQHTTMPPWTSNSIGSIQSSPLQPPFLQTPDDYDSQFNNYFLDPPKPGGFVGQSRRWPVSYLHSELPPNDTLTETLKPPKARYVDDTKYKAISNLIEVIKSNDLQNVHYQIQNRSDSSPNILHVQIPLPANFSDSIKQKEDAETRTTPGKLEILDLLFLNEKEAEVNLTTTTESALHNDRQRKSPLYSRSYVSKSDRRRRQGKNLGIIEFVPRPQ